MLALIWIFLYENSIQKVIHPWLKGCFTRVWFFISLRRNPPQVGVTSAQKLCTEIISIRNFCAVFSKEIISIKQHQMSKTNFKTVWKYRPVHTLRGIMGNKGKFTKKQTEAVKQMFFYIFPFWFHIWWRNIYSRRRNPYSRFTSVLESIEWMLWARE